MREGSPEVILERGSPSEAAIQYDYQKMFSSHSNELENKDGMTLYVNVILFIKYKVERTATGSMGLLDFFSYVPSIAFV